ncbi:hypothetical protein QKU48_gp0094 [Fadolivirus algeromassiliense]|jgi:hypothetical protein|uniref:Uncharacterized protein n=1 Tax=Fadolivirus FV1/VV64 TaxID=3070911 RepID=A0A7D3V5B0_9VIRU|nr:hypothetical protein QKU48_gp0094 [Fadolivirus algeromassiliense]QKF93552.1 hypothetical protein Fadolivirus_1_94 [Fadolivirus FV1/VV64]
MSCSKNCIEHYHPNRRNHRWRRDSWWRDPYYDPYVYGNTPIVIQQTPQQPQAPVQTPQSDLDRTINNPAIIIGYFCCFSLVAILAYLMYSKK